jgi:probable F420-dependent oxidoreductase
MFANGDRSAEPDHALALATEAERAGYESLWAVQHVVIPVEQTSRYPYASSGMIPGGTAVAIPDPLVWLGFVAAATTSIRLATGVLVAPQQHALLIAKQAATLDRLSRGRLILGVGPGWLREEFTALDADFDHRGARLDEQIAVLRAAWTEPIVTHDGDHIDFPPVVVEPKPHQATIPIVIGGHTPAAARRAGHVGDGFFPLAARGDGLADIVEQVRRAALDAGRDPDAIEITADAPRTDAEAEVVRRLDVRRVVVNAPAVSTADLPQALADRLGETLDRLAG